MVYTKLFSTLKLWHKKEDNPNTFYLYIYNLFLLPIYIYYFYHCEVLKVEANSNYKQVQLLCYPNILLSYTH